MAMDIGELLLTAVRSLILFVLMLAVIRLLGKRTVGNFTAFDLLVALMLGEVVDEIVFGDVPFVQGSLAIVAIAAAKYATTWGSFRSERIRTLVEGRPTVLVADGALLHDNMRKELMSDDEVLAGLRLEGVDDVRRVKQACLEVDGVISVIQHDRVERRASDPSSRPSDPESSA